MNIDVNCDDKPVAKCNSIFFRRKETSEVCLEKRFEFDAANLSNKASTLDGQKFLIYSGGCEDA